jgi:transposase InsO family protein
VQRGPIGLTAESGEFHYREADLLDEPRCGGPRDEDTFSRFGMSGTQRRLGRHLGSSTYTAKHFRKLCAEMGIRQSMGRVGSCFDNAAADSFFSSSEWEVLSRRHFRDAIQARVVVIDWCHSF